jgi:16S rRNA (adenine1518-N6/adenine1519-N6)-dimethyltransferase
MNPKKSLGQHWLHDEASLQAMLSAGDVKSGDIVLEVGPGLGTLTAKLCDVAERVIAVELDDILAANLSQNVKKLRPDHAVKNLTVIHESILDFDTSVLLKNYKVIANIPYYLTSHLVRIMLESSNPPSEMVLLVQKEVAQRIAAEPGQMGILSVTSQFYAQITLYQEVPAHLFTPPPKVDSQIVQLSYRSTPLFNDITPELFFKLVKAGFSEKRKKLRSSLSGALGRSKPEIDKLLSSAQIDQSARAQELTLQEWHRLYKTFQNT